MLGQKNSGILPLKSIPTYTFILKYLLTCLRRENSNHIKTVETMYIKSFLTPYYEMRLKIYSNYETIFVKIHRIERIYEQ